MSKTGIWTLVVIIIVIFAAVGVWFWTSMPATTPNPGTATPTSTQTMGGGTTTVSPTSSLTLAGGEVSLSYADDQFSLAASPEPLLVQSYIPPCDQGFNYCIYTASGTYAGTNFESAGIGIIKRTDLTSARLCLNTAPDGFPVTLKPAATSTSDLYSTSVFTNVGGAAAGHVAQDTVYRLFVNQSSSCYQFDARIGNSQFANYPTGTIQQFTDADRAAVQTSLQNIINSITLAQSGVSVAFPMVASQ